MQISSINGPHTVFGGIFSNLLVSDRINIRKPYKGKHLEKRHSCLECNSNYNRPLAQKRTVQRPKINTGSILRPYETGLQPEVNYVIDSDTKIAVGEKRIYDLNSSLVRGYTNFLEEGESIYLDPNSPIKKGFYFDDKKGDKIALTKISSSLFMLRAPKGVDERVSLLENIEYIDPGEEVSSMESGIKYAVPKNSVIEIDDTYFCLSDFDLSTMEDKDRMAITESMIKKDSDDFEFGSNAPLAYITKINDVFYFSLSPLKDIAFYCGRRSLAKEKPLYEERKNNPPCPQESPNTGGFDEVIDVDIIIPDKLAKGTFEANPNTALMQEVKNEAMPIVDVQEPTFADEFSKEAQSSSFSDPETLAKYKRILNLLGTFLKGQEFDPKSSCMTAKGEDDVEYFVFAGYKNGILSKINIIDLSGKSENSAKLTSFSVGSIDRLPEDKAKLAKAFLQFLQNKAITSPNGIALSSGDKH